MSLRWVEPSVAIAVFAAAATLTDEQMIARDWLEAHAGEYDAIAVEVKLYGDQVGARDHADALERMWLSVTALRADEVKVHARVVAARQVKQYLRLWRQEFPDVGLVLPRVICRSADIAVDFVMHLAGGAVERVAPRAV
jgi:hypothetical protein